MRLAFIGGRGHHYLRHLVNDPKVTLQLPIAVASDGYDEPAARVFAKLFKDVQWFNDPIQMMDRYKPDLLDIGAVYGHNGDMVAAALERDIPVTSDKPIATSWVQLKRIQKLVAQNPKRVIATQFPFRCLPEFRAARQAVAQGLLGKIVLATGQKTYKFGDDRPRWYADRESYGGTIPWVASHAIDVIRYVTGLPYQRAVGGMAGNLSKPAYDTMEDHTVSLLELQGGAAVVVHADYLQPGKAATHGDDRVRIAGSCGVLEVRDGRCKLCTEDQEVQDITERGVGPSVQQELLAAMQGQPSECFGTAASLEMAAVLLAARDAADNRRAVEIMVQGKGPGRGAKSLGKKTKKARNSGSPKRASKKPSKVRRKK